MVIEGLILLAVIVVLITLTTASKPSTGTRRKATVRKTIQEVSNGKDGSIRSHYYATFLFPDDSRKLRQYEISREEYGMLQEGDEVMVTSKDGEHAECALRKRDRR